MQGIQKVAFPGAVVADQEGQWPQVHIAMADALVVAQHHSPKEHRLCHGNLAILKATP
ncbi:MAG: hypothetical protein NW204_01655 [Xanthomonadaceae bacterium]|nr:hypothetical protein [Xanthomonadaceae bacterium]